MAELNIPNVNKKSNKFIFKNKFPLRRKSIRRLFTESSFMFILSLLLIYIIYLIPNKNLLLQNIPKTLIELLGLIIDLGSVLYQILSVIFILITLVIALILFLGSFNRLIRIFNRKTRKLNLK